MAPQADECLVQADAQLRGDHSGRLVHRGTENDELAAEAQP